MMSSIALILGTLAALPVALEPAGESVPGPARDLFALRVGEARTVSHGTIPHAVILVENGQIVVVGQDLEIERGIPVIDKPDWVVIPGLVHCQSRMGLDSQGHSGSTPSLLVSPELYPRQPIWKDLLETGVTTLGLYPDGNGIPGQACVVRPVGDTPAEMLVRDHAYLLMTLASNPGSKKLLRDGFASIDKYLAKEQEAYDKWAKKNEKKKKDEQEKYEPIQPDANTVPFMQLREGELSALIRIAKAADWLHLLDAIGEEEFDWSLRVQLRDDIDLHNVVDEIGERETRVVMNPSITLQPHTRRDRNLPAELAKAGARIAFVPGADSPAGCKGWLVEVGRLVGQGLDPEVALRAMTLEPAAVLRVDDQLGSLEAGKAANMIFLNGDPFEPTTQIQAVMLEGDIVHGEVQ